MGLLISKMMKILWTGRGEVVLLNRIGHAYCDTLQGRVVVRMIETRKSQINNLTLHLKQLEKEEMKNPRVSKRKEIFKIRAEINAKETKKTIAKINKAESRFFERINKIDK